MEDYKEMLKLLEEQQKSLQFSEFTNETALKLGLSIIDKARDESKAVTIDITRNGHQLFHYAFEGTSPDNDQWILRKNRVVHRFSKSSLYIAAFLESLGKSIEERYGISFAEYAPRGGAFPITIKNVGIVGTITVSGLPHEEDHKLVVNAIREFLNL